MAKIIKELVLYYMYTDTNDSAVWNHIIAYRLTCIKKYTGWHNSLQKFANVILITWKLLHLTPTDTFRLIRVLLLENE